MLFNSFDFILFFPLVTFLYFVLPHNFRWFMLLAASCIFYMYFIPKYILILILTIVIDYFAGILIEKYPVHRRKLLVLSIVANVGILMFFKYFNFFAFNLNELASRIGWNYSIPLLGIILPIGLSFHTFQAMSYTIEVYRGKQKAEKHFGIYALYVMYYPQLVAGPIERPQNLLHQFHQKHSFDYERFKHGLLLMLWGFFKKVVIADRLAHFANPVFDHPENYQGISMAIAAVFFTFQIFCDFSGYSDIAIGASEIMGIRLMKNFDRPYSSRSISEFWSRWHISLSTWFRDYLYIPLGGNRVSKNRWYLNLSVVFIVSGFWHGASWNFIVWGALHAFYLVFALLTFRFRENISRAVGLLKFPTLYEGIQIIIVFVLVCLAWVFFRAKDIGTSWFMIKHIVCGIPEYIGKVFADKSYPWLEPLFLGLNVKAVLADFALIVVSLLVLESVHLLQNKKNAYSWLQLKPVPFRWGVYLFFILFIMLFGMFHDNSEFIYFQF